MWEHQLHSNGRPLTMSTSGCHGDEKLPVMHTRSKSVASFSNADLTEWFAVLKRRQHATESIVHNPVELRHTENAHVTLTKSAGLPRPGTAVRRYPSGLLAQFGSGPQLVERPAGATACGGRYFDAPGWFEYAGYAGSGPGVFFQERALTTTFVARPKPRCWPSREQSSRRPSSATVLATGTTDVLSRLAVQLGQNDVSLDLTSRPNFGAALGLEQALTEARIRLDPTSARGLRLISAALAKRAEQRTEFQRCLNARESRITAFRQCRPIIEAIRVLVTASAGHGDKCKETSAAGLRFSEFMDWHRCLISNGFLHHTAVGPEMARDPFCYVPPAYIPFVRQFLGGVLAATEQEINAGDSSFDVEAIGHADELLPMPSCNNGATTEPGVPKRAEPTEDPEGLQVWDVGVRVWRLLVERGAVRDAYLQFDAFIDAVFDLADAHISQACRRRLKISGSSHLVQLQEYMDFVARLVRACVYEAVVDSTPPSTGPATTNCCDEGSHAAPSSSQTKHPALLAGVLRGSFPLQGPPTEHLRSSSTVDCRRQSPNGSKGERCDSSLQQLQPVRRASQSRPHSSPARRPSLSAGPFEARHQRVLRLRHCWPNPVAYAQETNRKLNLLRAAIEERAIGTDTSIGDGASRAFRACCQLAGKRRAGALGYAQLETALQQMPGTIYASVTFRHAVVGRELSDESGHALSSACTSDEGQTFSFFRALDYDGDGQISEKDFKHCVEHGFTDEHAGAPDKSSDSHVSGEWLSGRPAAQNLYTTTTCIPPR